MNNQYSTTWFELFLEPIQPAQTAHEVAFVARWLPLPAYTTVLDLCCGQGRHTRLLAEVGYRMTGVDRDEAALAAARRLSDERITYIQGDMRQLDVVAGTFDAIVCLWQSFGYFDPAANTEVLRQINRKLKPKGRLILDIYHCGFFERNQGVRNYEREGLVITETKQMAGARLSVRLDYAPGDGADSFEWQLYTPEQIQRLGADCGFDHLATCSGFDKATPASADSPRMQVVLEKLDAT
jgi:SAM-dependent methyltransferase